jgi:glycosyltransferase involved in cell wall biosynthesis
VRVLCILTYYRPHVSGLTIYVERLARSLAARGHDVTVLTARYNGDLPREEIMEGVRVVRVPVARRINKGVLMPSFPLHAWREIRSHDVVNVHLPQVEGALAVFLARLARRKPIITYHCDLQMPPAWYGKLVDRLTFWNNLLAGRMADTVVAYTQDFADHSPFLSAVSAKVRVILPPVVIPDPTPDGVERLRRQVGVRDGQQVIGFAARFAYEKGAGYLIRALPHILQAIPDVRLLFAGPYGRDVIGETIWEDLQPLIRQYQPYLAFLGTLSPAQMADFFALCDVVTVASINNTESFGLVQVESFMCGTPVVATDLPGVRQPVLMTGMGEIVPVADAEGLAAGILKVLAVPKRYVRSADDIRQLFDLDDTINAYEGLFAEKRAQVGATRPVPTLTRR